MMNTEPTESLDDQFLRQYQQPPRPAFVAALHHRLQANEAKAALPARFVWASPLGWGLAGLSLLCALILGVSPAARAEVAALLRTVGGISFEEIAAMPPPDPNEVVTTSPRVSLVEAQQILPASMPQFIPEGYTQLDYADVIVDTQFRNVTYYWHGGSSAIHLTVKQSDANLDMSQRVAPGSTQEIQINGQPAALVNGVWGDGNQWDPHSARGISWHHNGLIYQLTSFAGLEGGTQPLSKQQLIAIAESVP